jgi:hypothetical protein
MYDKKDKETKEVELTWRDIGELEDFVDMVSRLLKVMKDKDLEEYKIMKIRH